MSLSSRARRLVAALSLIAVGGPLAHQVHAEVTIVRNPAPFEITAAAYQARIDGDGCLASLRITGREFLAAGVSVSRGAYFFRNGTLALPQLEQPDATTVTARGASAEISYRCSDAGMTWTVRNESEDATTFFLVLAKDVDAAFLADGRIVAPAVAEVGNTAAFSLGDAKIAMDGIDRLWGPWQGPHQVCEISLGPHESRELTLSITTLTPAERSGVAAILKPSSPQPLTVFSPRDYQVVQRSEANSAECLISGCVATDADSVEYKITGRSRLGELPGEWRPAEFVPATRGFASRANVPAGGWYVLTVRAKRDDKVIAETGVAHFGVGEVFVGAGQSNSTNCGETPTQQTSGMVASFGGDQWKLADDPQLGVADRSTGGSFWPAFGDAMYERFGVPIGVATTGFGGTSVNQWQPDGDLFAWTMTRMRQLGPRGFRAVLWHQGESDVDMPADEYYVKLRRVIESSRTEAGWQIPWFVALASYHNMERPKSESVRSAQRRLWNEAVAMPGPDTDLLQEEYRDMGGKGIHFSPRGLRKHGQLWAERAAPFVDAQLHP